MMMKRLAMLLTVLALDGCATTAERPAVADPPLLEPTTAEIASLRADLAEMFVARGAFDAALPLLQEALRLAPRSARIHTLLGIVLRDRGVYAQAEQELKLALELEPGRASALSALGVLYDQEHRFEDAEQAHRDAVARARDCVKCWNNLGFSLFLERRDRAAIEAYEIALRLDPGARVIYNNLGFAYGRLGYEAAALRAFRQAGDEKRAQKNLALCRLLRARESRRKEAQ